MNVQTGQFESPTLFFSFSKRYAPHVLSLLEPHFRYLLVCLKWIPDHRGGPPYLVTHDEIKSLFGIIIGLFLGKKHLKISIFFKGASCNIEQIDKVSYPSMEEYVYLLTKNI